MSIISKYKKSYQTKQQQKYTLEEYLEQAKTDSMCYMNAAERLLRAIGEPKMVQTSKDPRMARIFGNRVIRQYEAFSNFYGLEDVIEKIVSYFRHAAQGLEESRQILYLVGPVGSAKSSLAERLKSLMEVNPIYVLADEKGNPSPINETPLGLFKPEDASELGIPERYLSGQLSPWAVKRLEEYKGDMSRFTVLKRFPSQLQQIAISKIEPGDEHNQDISTLVGKLDIRQLEFFSQDDPDAYKYCGGLGLSNQGVLEFVEMFKAPIKVLHPLLTATQEHNYKGTEAIGAIPFDGIILAHSNFSEWDTFKNNKNNEAFLDRVYVVEVGYCTRIDEEVEIYKKLLKNSAVADAPIAPNTLEMLAKFCILTRLDPVDAAETLKKMIVKMYVYNGRAMKEIATQVKSLQEYKDQASASEGFKGVSTRFAYKVLSEVLNFDPEEVAADPVHLLYILEQTIKREHLGEALEMQYIDILKSFLAPSYARKLGNDIQTAYVESYTEYGQSLFDRYIIFADHWVQDIDYRDPDSGHIFNREALNNELEKLEKPAQIANPMDFRHEIVSFALRYQAKNDGKNPSWQSYEKLKKVIEHNMFSKTEDLLPVISFTGQGSKEAKKKHEEYIKRMMELGYTEKQVRKVTEWHLRFTKG